eukprot:GILI01013992.1.p1 GENE.GILI01013992.1~~GILI01013992.1.p1  ORF type:complete len:476 (+),score=41.76 GILI01013992.1:567-1994(+)
MQQGVAMALLRMANCDEDVLNGNQLDVLVHPLRFVIGSGPTAYARGAIVGNLFIIPVAWSIFSYHVLPRLTSAMTGRSLVSSRDNAGWPSSTLIPFTMLSEGIAMVSVALVADFGSSVDVALGAFGLVALSCSLGVWIYILRARIPLQRLVLLRTVRSGFMKIADTRWEWALTRGKSCEQPLTDASTSLLNLSVEDVVDGNEASVVQAPPASGPAVMETSAILLRYNNCYGEFWWLYSSLAGYALSILVGIAEGMPSNTDALCRSRWVIASVGALLQSAVVLTCTVPFQLALIGMVGFLTFCLVVLITITTFGQSDLGVDKDALDVLGIANAVVGIVLMIFGLCRLAFEALRGRSDYIDVENKENAPTIAELEMDSLDVMLVTPRECEGDDIGIISVSSSSNDSISPVTGTRGAEILLEQDSNKRPTRPLPLSRESYQPRQGQINITKSLMTVSHEQWLSVLNDDDDDDAIDLDL